MLLGSIFEIANDIFVHSSGIKDHGFFVLQTLDRVSFEIKETTRGRVHPALPPYLVRLNSSITIKSISHVVVLKGTS